MPHRNVARSLSLWTALAVICRVGTAHAQSTADPTPEQLMQRGRELREQGHDDQALPLLERAYALRPTPMAAARLGSVEVALARWVAAFRHLTEALASPDAAVQVVRADVEQMLANARARVGRLDLRANVATGVVFIDGVRMGPLQPGTPWVVVAGRRNVSLEADGHERATATVEVAGGGSLTRESLTLVASAVHVERRAISAEGSNTLPPTAGGSAAGTDDRAARAGGSGGPRGAIGAALTIGGGALLVTGVVLTIVQQSNAAIYRRPLAERGCNDGRLMPSDPVIECRDQFNLIMLETGLFVASYIVGGLSLGAGVIVLATGGSRTSTAPRTAFTCLPGLASVTCGAAF